jgi:predicted branched-subunit amino acid permease
MRKVALTIWLCSIGMSAVAQTATSVSPCATAVCRGAPAPLVGSGVPAALGVGAVLLGAKLFKRKR